MITGTFLKSWKNVKQHIPLIKFRKGGTFRENSPSVLVATAGGRGSSENKTILQRHQLPVIEDWELPPQYRRCALDETEINAINSGGAY